MLKEIEKLFAAPVSMQKAFKNYKLWAKQYYPFIRLNFYVDQSFADFYYSKNGEKKTVRRKSTALQCDGLLIQVSWSSEYLINITISAKAVHKQSPLKFYPARVQ